MSGDNALGRIAAGRDDERELFSIVQTGHARLESFEVA
jgi:hypothetical protein